MSPTCMQPQTTAAGLLQHSTRVLAPLIGFVHPTRSHSCFRRTVPQSRHTTKPCPAAPQQQPSEPGASNSARSVDEEARLEAMEERLRGPKGTKAATSQMMRGKAPPMQIRNQVKPKDSLDMQQTDGSGRPPWKEGALFPEGWDRMNFAQQLTELYIGRRGFLFWVNKLAYGAALSLIVAWILFRFVGPNLGLYQLQGDLTTTL